MVLGEPTSFDSDSKYGIFIRVKYDDSKNVCWHDLIVAEVVGMTKRFPTVENMSASVRKLESGVDEKAQKLNLLLLNAVDETLKRVFKKAGAEVVYNYIENECLLKREQIAKKPKVFSACLQKMLGSGAFPIEKSILKNLHDKLELKFREKEGCEFADYVKELRKRSLHRT